MKNSKSNNTTKIAIPKFMAKLLAHEHLIHGLPPRLRSITAEKISTLETAIRKDELPIILKPDAGWQWYLAAFKINFLYCLAKLICAYKYISGQYEDVDVKRGTLYVRNHREYENLPEWAIEAIAVKPLLNEISDAPNWKEWTNYCQLVKSTGLQSN